MHEHAFPVQVLENERRVCVVAHEDLFWEKQVADWRLVVVLGSFEADHVQRDEQAVVGQD